MVAQQRAPQSSSAQLRNLVRFGLAQLLLASCTGGSQGPLVLLHLRNLSAATAAVSLSTSATDPAGRNTQREEVFRAPPFDLLGVRFPSGTRGPVEFTASSYQDGNCLLDYGSAQGMLADDSVIERNLDLQPQQTCAIALATLSVMVIGVNNPSISVTSVPPGIRCGTDPANRYCTTNFIAGTQVRLHATPLPNINSHWCQGEPFPCVNPCAGNAQDCLLKLVGDTQIVALY